MEKLDITAVVKTTKQNEFKQTLDSLNVRLHENCPNLKINQSENSLRYSIFGEWKTKENLHAALQIKECKILFGAIESLCEDTSILLNDKLIGNSISKLNTL